MSGPNPPGPESEELEPGVEASQGDGGFGGGDGDFGAGAAESGADSQTGQTDVYSRAYSAPESEHISSGPYVPANLDLYDYDSYDEATPADDRREDCALAVDRRRRRDRRGDSPGRFGVAAVCADRHHEAGHARHRAADDVDTADSGRDHRDDDDACATSTVVQRGTPTATARPPPRTAADHRPLRPHPRRHPHPRLRPLPPRRRLPRRRLQPAPSSTPTR